MNNLVLILVLVAGGVSGYFIGAHQGKAAIETLAAVNQAAEQQKVVAERTISALKESMARLATAHKSELDKIESDYQQQRAKLDDAVAAQKIKSREQTSKINIFQQETGHLGKNVESATDPVEKQKLLNKITQPENEKKFLVSENESLKCLSVAVPDDVLRQLQGSQP